MTDWRKTSGHPTPPATLLPSAIRPLPSVICHLSFAIRHSGLTLAPFPSRRPRDVRLGIELLACALVAHEPHGAEDRPLGPWAVVLAANRPGNSGVAVGVAAVHLVAIVQIDRDPKRRLGVDRPFQDLLCQVYAHIIIYVAGNDHLHL